MGAAFIKVETHKKYLSEMIWYKFWLKKIKRGYYLALQKESEKAS